MEGSGWGQEDWENHDCLRCGRWERVRMYYISYTQRSNFWGIYGLDIIGAHGRLEIQRYRSRILAALDLPYPNAPRCLLLERDLAQ